VAGACPRLRWECGYIRPEICEEGRVNGSMRLNDNFWIHIHGLETHKYFMNIIHNINAIHNTEFNLIFKYIISDPPTLFNDHSHITCYVN